MKKYQLIQNTRAGQAMKVYIITDKNGAYVGHIHLALDARYKNKEEKRMRIDVYEYNLLSYQYAGEAERFPFPNAFDGIEIANLQLFREGVKVNHDEPALGEHEAKTYLPGLNRLKGAGYKIICVL